MTYGTPHSHTNTHRTDTHTNILHQRRRQFIKELRGPLHQTRRIAMRSRNGVNCFRRGTGAETWRNVRPKWCEGHASTRTFCVQFYPSRSLARSNARILREIDLRKLASNDNNHISHTKYWNTFPHLAHTHTHAHIIVHHLKKGIVTKTHSHLARGDRREMIRSLIVN